MTEEAAEQECECEEGLPAWMATFADMMALLMCFFVLLLSFAEMDAVRFKKMADAMKDAFGVQKEIPANEIVKGISVVTLDFSPSIAEPSITENLQQETTDKEKEHLEVRDGPKDAGEPRVNSVALNAAEELRKAEAREQAKELKASLKKEIDEGIVSIEVVDSNVIIRINEKGSFPSGSAELNPGFTDVLDRIAVAISTRPGKVIVAGHTDNRPIATRRFRSNWELSVERAVTVAHVLLADPTLDPKRFLLEGHADSDPLAPNDTPENRARNRRVELIIKHAKDEVVNGTDVAGPDGGAGEVPPAVAPEPLPGAVAPEPFVGEAPVSAAPDDIIAPPMETNGVNAEEPAPVIAPPGKLPKEPAGDIPPPDEVIDVEELI